MMVSTIITNMAMIFIIAAISSHRTDYDNDSCNDNDDRFKLFYKYFHRFKLFYKYFHLGRFPPVVHLPFENNSVLDR